MSHELLRELAMQRSELDEGAALKALLEERDRLARIAQTTNELAAELKHICALSDAERRVVDAAKAWLNVESPRWYENCGKLKEAIETLVSMEAGEVATEGKEAT